MFKKLFGTRDDAPTRTLSTPTELQVGDLITLKPRSTLPECLQGETLEVIKVATYEYPGGFVPSFSLKSSTNRVISLEVSDDSGDIELIFSVEISRNTVFDLFGESEFAGLWGDDFIELATNTRAAKADLEGWLAPVYRQTEKMVEAYFYNKDMRGQRRSKYASDDAEEMRYHACSGGDDEKFGLTVEIWEGGETEVYVSKSFTVSVIEEMWPSAK